MGSNTRDEEQDFGCGGFHRGVPPRHSRHKRHSSCGIINNKTHKKRVSFSQTLSSSTLSVPLGGRNNTKVADGKEDLDDTSPPLSLLVEAARPRKEDAMR